jgi:hypothetical protein
MKKTDNQKQMDMIYSKIRNKEEVYYKKDIKKIILKTIQYEQKKFHCQQQMVNRGSHLSGLPVQRIPADIFNKK